MAAQRALLIRRDSVLIWGRADSGRSNPLGVSMKTAVNRLRGVERDIVQMPQIGRRRAVLRAAGERSRDLRSGLQEAAPRHAQGPDGLRQDALPRTHGVPVAAALVTVSCHEDLTSSDLVGRFLLEGAETVWQDGPLTRAVKAGAICYLDEIVEARTDSTVVIHSLTDHRRKLTIEKKGQEIEAHEDFMLVISYNPGYQTVLKDLKPSTKQRFVAINFDFPPEEIERKIVMQEAPGISPEIVASARRGRAQGAAAERPRPRRGDVHARAGLCGQHDQRRPRPGRGVPGRHDQSDHR